MKYNGVILKKFAIMDDELSRLRALGEMTTARLDGDHFLKHGVERVDSTILVDILGCHLDDLTVFRNEVAGAA